MKDLAVHLRIIWLRCHTDLTLAQLARRFEMDPHTIKKIVTTNPFEVEK